MASLSCRGSWMPLRLTHWSPPSAGQATGRVRRGGAASAPSATSWERCRKWRRWRMALSCGRSLPLSWGQVAFQCAASCLHLDDCDETNGPLLVLPGSHLGGRLTAPEIQHQRTQMVSVPCPVPSGGALLMRPLLLHASSASQSPRHRRVIHLEYAAEPLPGGLQWHRSRRETAS